jgi:hypothetical protein
MLKEWQINILMEDGDFIILMVFLFCHYIYGGGEGGDGTIRVQQGGGQRSSGSWGAS